MKANRKNEGLEKLLQWNLISSSDWSKIDKLYESLNQNLEIWLNDHQGYEGYKKAGEELGLGPKDTYQTISAMMKAAGKNDGLEQLLQWNQIPSGDWSKIAKLYESLKNDHKKWLKAHQGFDGYKKAGEELGLGPQDTYQTISAMMKAAGQNGGLEKLLKCNFIPSSDWNKIDELYESLKNEPNIWLEQHQGFDGYKKAGEKLCLGPNDTY
jgi:hypothetical protein